MRVGAQGFADMVTGMPVMLDLLESLQVKPRQPYPQILDRKPSLSKRSMEVMSFKMSVP